MTALRYVDLPSKDDSPRGGPQASLSLGALVRGIPRRPHRYGYTVRTPAHLLYVDAQSGRVWTRSPRLGHIFGFHDPPNVPPMTPDWVGGRRAGYLCACVQLLLRRVLTRKRRFPDLLRLSPQESPEDCLTLRYSGLKPWVTPTAGARTR